MKFAIGFICRGQEQGWVADNATEAHKVIDVLNGDIPVAEFMAWIAANYPQWVDAAVAMTNYCIVGA